MQVSVKIFKKVKQYEKTQWRDENTHQKQKITIERTSRILTTVREIILNILYERCKRIAPSKDIDRALN